MFRLGQNSLEVVQSIVEKHPEIQGLKIVSHEVFVNWRQLYKDSKDKILKIEESLTHSVPLEERSLSRDEFLKLSLASLSNPQDNKVWSFCSLVTCSDGSRKHIPMMNFHPIDVSVDELKIAISIISRTYDGVFLSSGRFYHCYGDALLDHSEWIKFMTDFLMPCILVSPRYIGHRLFDGYCTLRLTADQTHKTKVPVVIDILKRS